MGKSIDGVKALMIQLLLSLNLTSLMPY
jgi:hypothetical protein